MSLSQIDAVQWAQSLLSFETDLYAVRCNAENLVYELRTSGKSWFLKLSANALSEAERLQWLHNKLPVPEVIACEELTEGGYAMLTTGIPGMDLADLVKYWPYNKVISKLAEALHIIHGVNLQNCPFGEPGANHVLVHGDACLPNFMFLEDGTFTGFIDLADMRIDNVEVDLSAAVWSLQYNMGQGYGVAFLKEYGIENATGEMEECLRLQYESG